MNTRVNTYHQWVDYVRHGLAITPIKPGTKSPSLPNWNSKPNAITTPRQVHGHTRGRRLDGSAGVLLAFCKEPLMSLDIDNWSLAEPWFSSHGIDLGDLFIHPDAVQIQSGVPNKGKLLFKIPTPMVHYVIRDEGETVVEFRCMNSNGGSLQDVLPPSIHPDTGNPYTWSGDYKKMEWAPDVLLELWQSLLDEKEESRQVHSESSKANGTTGVVGNSEITYASRL